MSGLILKLRPNEEVLINGAVIQNGNRKAYLRVITPAASVLRLRDAIRPEEATTPVRQAYYLAQLAVAGSMPAARASEQLGEALDALSVQYERSPEMSAIDIAKSDLQAGRLYAVMQGLKAIAFDQSDMASPRPSALGAERRRA